VKLQNSTNYGDRFLRRMVSWCCRQLEMPASYVRGCRFGNATNHWGGRAYLRQRRIGVRVGGPTQTDRELKHHRFGDGFQVVTYSRLEVLLITAAHELAHLDLYRRGNRSRGNGRGHGGSERYTEGRAFNVLQVFRSDSERLVEEWSLEPAVAARQVPSVQDRRALKAASKLVEWQRKAKLAATKVKQYKRQVRYYERTLAAKRSV
jgi:hypothetical protein